MRSTPPQLDGPASGLITVAPHSRARRPRIAVLLDYMSFLDGAYQSQVSDAFDEEAQKLDVDLLLVFGRGLDEPNLHSRGHNTIFELIDRRSADAVIVLSTALAAHTGPASVSRLVSRHAGLPVLSLGVELPEVPSVVLDNFGAMSEVVEHVVGHHWRRRVAFVAGFAGSPESELRLAAYRDVLGRHGIPFDPRLVAYGNFVHWTGHAATAEIIARAPDIDALVAANDTMALGAIEALRERGFTVPDDVLVTGFDDIRLGRLGDPALTTVAQPFEAMAEHALTLALMALEGRELPSVTTVPAEFVRRRSCGCTPGAIRNSAPPPPTPASSPSEHLQANLARVILHLASELRFGCVDGTDHAILLVDGLRRELDGHQGVFLRSLELLLRRLEEQHDGHQTLHNVINTLRAEFAPCADRGLDDLWYRALSRVAFSTTKAEVEHRIELDNKYMQLLTTADRVSVALDLPALEHAIVTSLPSAGIRTAFVSRVVDSGAELESLVCCVDGQPLGMPRRRFAASELVPPGCFPPKRHTSAVFPLVFETQWLGVAVFAYSQHSHGYQMIRDQIAASLGNITLHQQVLAKTMLHERSVQERQATTRRIEALSVLAGGVAHDLNNTLGPLVALPDVIMQELTRLGESPTVTSVLADVYADMHSIKSAAQRAAQTIKDLLTLGRQGRALKEAHDLNRIVESALSEPLRLVEKTHGGIEFSFDLYPEPLLIKASEAHVARAVTNLVHNAVEAIEGSGRVVLRTDYVRVREAFTGYETIEPGDYAVFSISDNGSGIPESVIEHIFEPFYSGKRVGERSGSGLGLAIVHGVAKEHEGFVDLRSEIGEGTTFTLYIPRSGEELALETATTPPHRGSARILVVDDDPMQGRTARRVLAHLGYSVDVIQSGARAFETVKLAADSAQGPYDLLILDVMLNEERDGLEVLEQIRRAFPAQKAVLASGQSPRLPTGGRDKPHWLPKPYTTETLAEAVKSGLNGTHEPSARPVRRLTAV